MKEMLNKRSKQAHRVNSKRKITTQENDTNENGDIANIVAKLKKGGRKKVKSK